MKISPEEQHAIQLVCQLGAKHGYGSIISHLRTAWARHMHEQHGMSEEDAAEATHGGSVMPFLMQDDLFFHGYWDETGERYRSKPEGRE